MAPPPPGTFQPFELALRFLRPDGIPRIYSDLVGSRRAGNVALLVPQLAKTVCGTRHHVGLAGIDGPLEERGRTSEITLVCQQDPEVNLRPRGRVGLAGIDGPLEECGRTGEITLSYPQDPEANLRPRGRVGVAGIDGPLQECGRTGEITLVCQQDPEVKQRVRGRVGLAGIDGPLQECGRTGEITLVFLSQQLPEVIQRRRGHVGVAGIDGPLQERGRTGEITSIPTHIPEPERGPRCVLGVAGFERALVCGYRPGRVPLLFSLLAWVNADSADAVRSPPGVGAAGLDISAAPAPERRSRIHGDQRELTRSADRLNEIDADVLRVRRIGGHHDGRARLQIGSTVDHAHELADRRVVDVKAAMSGEPRHRVPHPMVAGMAEPTGCLRPDAQVSGDSRFAAKTPDPQVLTISRVNLASNCVGGVR